MASFDPSVISQIPDYAPDPVGAQAKAFKLADLRTQEQSNRMLLADQKQQQEDQAKQKRIFEQYADKIGTPEGNVALAGALAKEGLVKPAREAMQFGGEQDLRQLQQSKERLQILGIAANELGPSAKGMMDQLAPNGQLNPQALPMVQARYQQEVARILPMIPPQMRQNIPQQLPNDPQQALQMLQKGVANSEQARQMIAQDRATRKETRDEERLDLAEQAGQRAERREIRAERTAARTAQGKPPAGFEWDPDKEDTLRPIPGGPKDPNSKPWTGREKVFGERIITSANEAASAIRNITELPIGASTGMLGVGGSPGHSMYQATRDVLRNKLSSQEVQDYNVMLAGVRRNLSTIESAGLAPPGSLTESMSSLELREGDSQITKLRKLADMRHITDAGIEVQLADPAIPDSIKAVARKALDTIHKAVPFTHQELTKLQASPQKTLQQLIDEKGLRSGTVSGGAPEPGTVVKGYRFKGGDPADKSNWEKTGG